MDKAAFLAASRHGRNTFVTASCDRIDFAAPALVGELAEAVATVTSVGRTSIKVTVELHAEALLSGERRLCTRGVFVMVAPGRANPLPPAPDDLEGDPAVPSTERTVFMEMVFPPATNHYGTLYGGDALSLMGRAAFVHATRVARGVMVMAHRLHQPDQGRGDGQAGGVFSQDWPDLVRHCCKPDRRKSADR